MATHQSKTIVGKFTWRKSILSDVVELAANMRLEDKAEVLAYSGSQPKEALFYCFFNSKPCMTMVGRKGNLMGMYGVVPCSPKVGRIWMLGHETMTDDYKDVRDFLKYSPIELQKFHCNYPLLYNYVDERNTTHIKWIKWMGFSIIKKHATFGAAGTPFYEFVKN
tara:strand:- start:230 stop:724 length:495 start_codon:yes stop_codon:yes gene_type:complete